MTRHGPEPCDGAVVHAGELVVGLAPDSPPLGPDLHLERYADGAVAWLDGLVVEAGPTDEVLAEWAPRMLHDAGGRAVTAGLVDAHTHLVFAGSRAGEFAERLAGVSYEEVARRGGGILATVRATRAASVDELVRLATGRAWRMLAHGTTTIEAKSGYDLTRAGELRLLEVAAEVGRATPLAVIGTVLAAHVVPPEYAGRPDDYVAEVAGAVAREARARGLAEFQDAFVERTAFTTEHARALAGEAGAGESGLGLRLHVDQLSDGGGAALAAELGCVSADHLDFAAEDGVSALARAGVTAVLTPGASLTLGGPTPPIAALRAHAVPTAIATDFNPGTSTVDSLVLCLALACRLYGLTPEEAFVGVTESAAKSLRRAGRIGCLRPGAAADIVVWEAPDILTLAWHFGPAWARDVFRGGVRVLHPEPRPGA